MGEVVLSNLPKTWFIDIDGVIFAHNSHLEGEDRLLPGAKEFIDQIPKSDLVMLLSARQEKYRMVTEASLTRADIRYDTLVLDLPVGERILINDIKPQGLHTAIAINTKRDNFNPPSITYSETL